MSAKEELVRVERFEELRAGMLVVLDPCGECGGRHRTMLVTHQETAPGPLITDEWVELEGWQYAPGMPCDDAWGDIDFPPAITPLTVERGALFRVIDGLEAPSQTTSRRHLKPARVG